MEATAAEEEVMVVAVEEEDTVVAVEEDTAVAVEEDTAVVEEDMEVDLVVEEKVAAELPLLELA